MFPPHLPLYFLVLLFPPTSLGDCGATQQACAALHSALHDRIYFPGSKPFNESIGSYAYMETRLSPSCIVGPTSAAEVSKAVEILVQHPTVEFAVRSGGHNPNKGFANTDHGVTIDLAAMNKVELSQDRKTVSIETGARWAKVYATLEQHGDLSVVGGRVGTVGTGGYITGGGIGYFSPAQGWACDSVTTFDVVLSNATLISANATSHPTLFAALKGGGNNFGIVTRFSTLTLPQGNLTGGLAVFPNRTGEELMDAITRFKHPEAFDPRATFMALVAYDVDSDAWRYQTAFQYARPEEFAESTMEAFVEAADSATIRNATAGYFAGRNVDFGSIGAPGIYMHFTTLTIRQTPTILHKINTQFRASTPSLAQTHPNISLTLALVLQPLPSSPSPTTPNTLSLPPFTHPEKTLLNALIMCSHASVSATGALENEVKALTQSLEGVARTEDAHVGFVYANYAGAWQGVVEGYGGEGGRRLRRAAGEYDPGGVWWRQVRGGFKVGSSEDGLGE